MAYGKRKEQKNWLRRAIPLGVGPLTPAQRQHFHNLREILIEIIREMVSEAFIQEPLTMDDKGVDQALLEVQRFFTQYNSVWREQARMVVTPALEACYKRYNARLIGGLRNVHQRVPWLSVTEKRKYINIPESVQDQITEAEIAQLQALGEYRFAIPVFRKLVRGEPLPYTPAQIEVLRFLHQRAQEKHKMPMFAASDTFTVALHLNAKMFHTSQQAVAVELHEAAVSLLEDQNNQRFHYFLDLAGIAPRDPRMRVPLTLSKDVAKRIEGTSVKSAALTLELSEKHIGLRLVAGKPPPPSYLDLDHVSIFLGRDFGYSNTVTLSVVAGPKIAVEEVQQRLAQLENKYQIADFYRENRIPDGVVQTLETVRFSGRNFLASVNRLSRKIDLLRSRIDKQYQELEERKAQILEAQGISPQERMRPEWKSGPLGDLVREFYAKLGQIQSLKRARRELYRRIAGLKKSWFGYLSNVEVQLAQKYGAAIAREDLTVEAIEKESPKYRGRTFNRMINNGSKGQYQRRASQKFLWNGVPEIVIPSWYTSRACVRHASILPERKSRDEYLLFPCCGQRFQRDEHASGTIGSVPFLCSPHAVRNYWFL